MKRYVIERDIPGVGNLTGVQFRDLAETSNRAIAKFPGKIQWVQSFVAANRTFCVYLAESEAIVREHSRLAGFPITAVTEAHIVIDPMTAFSRTSAHRDAANSAVTGHLEIRSAAPTTWAS